jgi:hypothetical protein
MQFEKLFVLVKDGTAEGGGLLKKFSSEQFRQQMPLQSLNSFNHLRVFK